MLSDIQANSCKPVFFLNEKKQKKQKKTPEKKQKKTKKCALQN